MMEKLESLSRHVVGNRRRHPRRRLKYDVVVRDDIGREIFRGKSRDVSRSGVSILGLAAGLGISEGQDVRVEFLLLPKDVSRPAERAPVMGKVCRVAETDNGVRVAIMFERTITG